MIFLALWILFALQLPPIEPGSSGFPHIRDRVDVEAVPADSTKIAGLYVNPPNELAQKSDSSGIRTNLYLFPDQTYLFAERGSYLPVTVFDKGTWRFGSGVLELKSDPDVTWNPDLERRFLMLHRTAHSEEVLLVGADKAVNRFEALAGGNPENALLTVSKQRIKIITTEQATRVRDNVMRKAWHPERFGAKNQRPLS